MSRVVHFEFATPDPAQEIEFFKAVFGWRAEQWAGAEYWLVYTGEDGSGIDGAIMPQQALDQPRVVNMIGVEDLDDSICRATEAGARVAVEKQEVQGVGWTAYMLSPTGILFGMIQPMPGSMM